MREREIVFCVRKNFLEEPGGDTDQALTWKAVLEKLGNRVTLLFGSVTEKDLQRAECVFLWHLERPHESYQQFLTAKRTGKSIVLVPTCWHGSGKLAFGKILRAQLAQWARAVLRFRDPSCRLMLNHLWAGARRDMLKTSTLLLVNSRSEAELMIAGGADPGKVLCIPNVIRPADFRSLERKPWEERSTILCIGHFCPRKNQLALIEALEKTDLTVTFVGTARPMHRAYFRYCRRKAGNRHRFLGRLPHAEVLKLLAEAKLCISVSRSETPGIGNLEAGYLGSSLLLPALPPVEEYFQSLATYFDPDKIDPERILEAAGKAPSPELRERIEKNFTDQAVEKFFDLLDLPTPAGKNP
ncbi:MAG: glycosyltransferase family 4 protein [Lentisphaeria bacterium]|nr:glycosyltransferase family 4 protein [Lentisphaeria bacterium]